MSPASFMPSDLLMHSSSRGPLPAQTTDLRTQNPGRAVDTDFETPLCHFESSVCQQNGTKDNLEAALPSLLLDCNRTPIWVCTVTIFRRTCLLVPKF